MSRPKSITKKDFLDAYAKNKTVVDLAIELGVCEMTIRNYLNQFGLEVTGTVEKRKKTAEIYKTYREKISITDLAKRFKLPIVAVQYHLRKGMIDVYSSEDKPKWPRPHLLSHIKIIHALEENPGLRRKPEKLAEITHLSDESVAIYLNRLPATVKRRSK